MSAEGWAPMHNTQRSFHYYRRVNGVLKALCGKWAIPASHEAHLPLDEGDRKGKGLEGDCAACFRKSRIEP